MNINTIVAKAGRNGFESYGSFNEDGEQHEIFTCIKGKYEGEVIDVYYNWHTGEVRKFEISCQRKGDVATFVL